MSVSRIVSFYLDSTPFPTMLFGLPARRIGTAPTSSAPSSNRFGTDPLTRDQLLVVPRLAHVTDRASSGIVGFGREVSALPRPVKDLQGSGLRHRLKATLLRKTADQGVGVDTVVDGAFQRVEDVDVGPV